ncbi:MAG: hypothetical protein AAB209_10560 [Bacteroidota bacterium]
MTSGEIYRPFGLLPLFFFVLHALTHWPGGGWPHMLWMCIIGNLLIALGILLRLPLPIRIGVSWLILGLGLWLWFWVLKVGTSLPSVLAHVGGLIVGLVALSKVRADRSTWLYASLWYLAVQQLCRAFTPKDLNVNIAHRVYDGLEVFFTAYGGFWLATTILAALGLWLVGVGLQKLWPPGGTPTTSAVYV